MKYLLCLVVPLLIVWLILIPLSLFFKLKRSFHQLNEMKMKLTYGFLYEEYHTRAYYWEFVKIFEKISIVFFINIFTEDIYIKGFFILQLILIYGVVSRMVKPYKDKYINSLDSRSTFCAFITILLALFVYNNPYSEI